MQHTTLWSCTHIPNKYYLKNKYLTSRSKDKVPRRSLRYTTHRLMVMHPHTKYHWPISKDKNVMARTRKHYLKNNYLTLRSKSHEDYYGTRHTALWSCTHIPNIIDLSGKTKKLWFGQASLRRSRSGRKIRLKQYVSLRSKERHNNIEFDFTMGTILSTNEHQQQPHNIWGKKICCHINMKKIILILGRWQLKIRSSV
jgi:hypothetical protein